MYTGLLFDRHGRVSSVIRQSSPLPMLVDAGIDTTLCCLGPDGKLAQKSELTLVMDPPLIDGVVEVEAGRPAIFYQIPGGTEVCNGPAPLAQFDSVDDMAFSADVPGEYQLVFDSPRHLLYTVLVRVIVPLTEPEE